MHFKLVLSAQHHLSEYHRQPDSLLLDIRLDHLDLDNVADFHDLRGVLHKLALLHAGDVHEAVLVYADVHKGAEVNDISHGAAEYHAGLQILNLQHIAL